MYILLFKPIAHKNIPLIFKWITMLFSWSKYNHSAIFYNNKVYEMKGHGFQAISLKQCLKESKSKIHAFEFIGKFDDEKLKKLFKRLKTAKYDGLGAVYSEAEKLGFFGKLFKSKDENKIFCSEVITIILKENGYLPNDFDSNRYSPQEVLDKMKKLKVINPIYEIWK